MLSIRSSAVQPAAGTLRVYGGPEALLTLADEGLLGHRAVLINSDSPGLPAASVVTDTLRRRIRNFGELRTNYSPTLTATQDARLARLLDRISAVGPYGLVVTAAMPLVFQILANHRVMPPNRELGVLPPDELLNRLPPAPAQAA